MRSPTGLEPTSVRVFGDGPGAVLTGDHWFDVPLDHAEPGRHHLRVYAREVRLRALADVDQPYLVFLQGGPGGRSPRPGTDAPGWLAWALARYRVILLDQRGTGRSTPVDRHTLATLADAARLAQPQGSGGRAAARRQADYLAHLRADAIVADAEVVRRGLLGDQPWTVLGQSFGGFCTWTYLSHHPQGLAAAYVTGGVPPLGAHADDVYRATWRAVQRRTRDLDEAHPGVREGLAHVARHLERVPEYLPTGERLGVARLQEVGVVLGGAGGIDRLAHLVDDAWAVPGESLSDTFLHGVAEIVSYATRPLYALVHEACYADAGMVTAWSAQRVREHLGVPTAPVGDTTSGQRREVLPLTGEMVYPHTVIADPALAPLASAAHDLAAREWSRPLYDADRLAANTVPVAAMIYTQDMYVDPELSRRAAAATGAVTLLEDDQLHHDGLRRAGASVLDRLAEALGDAAAPPTRPAPTPAAQPSRTASAPAGLSASPAPAGAPS
ncbi:MAG: alpha/beta fold hydrolase [Kineosporiaceae bacterium]